MSQYFSEMFYVALFFVYFGLVQDWATKKIPKPWWKKMLLVLALILPVYFVIIKLVPDEYFHNSNMSAFFIVAILGMVVPEIFRYFGGYENEKTHDPR